MPDDSLDKVPLQLRLDGLAVPLAVWAFTLTNPPGGRHPAESKIQLIAPGQRSGDRGNLDCAPGTFKLLVGVHPSESLFVLWDAYKQRDFTFSQHVQVQGPLLWDAALAGVSTGVRRLRTGLETVVVARGDRLHDAIRQRISAE